MSDSRTRPRREDPSGSRTRDAVLLIGCVKGKHQEARPAHELYRSPLWQARKEYALRSRRKWFILSALHGLIAPDDVIAPYDLALRDLTVAERRAWAAGIVESLERRIGPVDGASFEIHAGSAYRRSLEPILVGRGAAVSAPTARIPGVGAQVAWYRAAAGTDRRTAATPDEVDEALRALDHEPLLVAASDWPGSIGTIDQPGLYAWWADNAGAETLSCGLGEKVLSGRIYAGLTGATKWPSGRTGKSTLRSRIAGNHLRGRIRGSTFRLTLAAVLADELGLVPTEPKRLANASEQMLSDWIDRHLSVAVHPFPDADTLADLERLVLAQLDPPLNLDGMPPTAARARLAKLRSSLLRRCAAAPRATIT
jgi:hypothetical protein